MSMSPAAAALCVGGGGLHYIDKYDRLAPSGEKVVSENQANFCEVATR